MKPFIVLLILFFTFSSCSQVRRRTVDDFNFGWKFSKNDISNAQNITFDDTSWEDIRLPHDWSILGGYQKDKGASSTGFTEGGIGWYRKTFTVPASDRDREIWIEFDGVYCNSTVYINGEKLGFRPSGYASFSYTLSNHLKYGEENVIAVKVDHSNFVDSRWYTGSGIYRDVRLVKTAKTHIPQWGVQITTPEVTVKQAFVRVKTTIKGKTDHTSVKITLMDEKNTVVAESEAKAITGDIVDQKLQVLQPKRWGIETPHLYTAKIQVLNNGKMVDEIVEQFGIRAFNFDAKKGFFLNGRNVKIKGVNLHHDVGAVGAAAVRDHWLFRLKKLKSVGVNAIRMAHNPHSPLLMDLCDEMGFLVMNEAFDEWYVPKAKMMNCLGGKKASKDISEGYPEVFREWAERDLKDLIRRDYNHPSVIMWSIGNEIEWTFPAYSQTYAKLKKGIREYEDTPTFDTTVIKPVFEEVTGGVDSLSIIAHQLSKWVKEEDTTRPTVCGSVRPSIAFASGYADAVDILGLNYREIDYDAAHEAFPNKMMLGSENWVAYSEWKAVQERDFIPGIFVWTGFAYLGEAGLWPRKGLNISLFDFAGFKNPRGHFFECLWKEDPKVYMVTTPVDASEYSYTKKDGWKFDIQLRKPPVWAELRLWEWYNVNEHWNYKTGEDIVVQTYTNCEEAELFLNGKSLGKQSLADFSDSDNIIKWLVPYHKGELKVVGYNNGQKVEEYVLNTVGEVAKIVLASDQTQMKANQYDVAHITVKMFDEEGYEIKNAEKEVTFHVSEELDLLGVDNGSEMNVSPHNTNHVKSHKGRALAMVRSMDQKGDATVYVSVGDVKSNEVVIELK
ncbi:glycoside hydrolase family 2 TIM barrel-domain containing protein [Flammeovirga sp. SJP92]|uniref:glycoside hydrolase family 2 TIM barrel-domain containing protein n=1 Tax=Flammeovirga sp. SJP92 TaxID=1775430 RepID=UPI0007868CF2|nr:glycoside hydrolase family 2 TIM barrel-domain containing protein [Flammeovirga sp. SJP92]KXX69254.1 glycosyl hydrolase family 2 [Flammeovirga sp. SJP92]